MRAFWQAIFSRERFYLVLGGVILLQIGAYFLAWPGPLARVSLFVFGGVALLDLLMLFSEVGRVEGGRLLANRFSNGDQNPVELRINNPYGFSVTVVLIDEVPAQFQERDKNWRRTLKKGEQTSVHYSLRPVERGVYAFGKLNAFYHTPIGFFQRRFVVGEPVDIPVYPAFLQMRAYEFLAIHDRLHEAGVKRIRRMGHTMEFEHIRPYVQGDDFRSVNWKATARAGDLMVNQYQDERSQRMYCLIDKGRIMGLPFDGMTLLDYSINAALVLGNIALKKGDKAGLMTFSKEMDTVLQASDRSRQLSRLQEILYHQKTNFLESDFEKLYLAVRRHIGPRSLLLLFTNFETRSSMQRQLKYLRLLAKKHVVVVVFFENDLVKDLSEQPPRATEDIYIQTMARHFIAEKKAIVNLLRHHGIYAVLTKPADLTVSTINAYLELKYRGIV